MIRNRHILSFGVFALLFACSEGSSIKPTTSDRPANYSRGSSEGAARGELIEATRIVSLSQAAITERIKALGIEAKTGVSIYKITYMTETPAATPAPIEASGIIVVPDTKASVYPWVSVQHGTIVGKIDAPSLSYSEGVLEASQGFVAVVADYIGFGSASEVFHPYLVAEAYADAGVDMLRAAKSFASKNTLTLGPLFLRGYSEGGYATLALQKALETQYATELPITASAPAAGPYDLVTSAKILTAQETANPVNLPFVVLSYNKWLTATTGWNIDNVIQLGQAKAYPLFSGSFRTDDIIKTLPSKTAELFKADVIADVIGTTPTTAEGTQLRTWFTEQSLHNKSWAPSVQTRLYHCRDDKTVPVEATTSAYASFKAINADSPVVPAVIDSPDAANPYTHTTCPGIYASLTWFGEILAKAAAAQAQ